MEKKYFINNWHMEHCTHFDEKNDGDEDSFFLIKGDYNNHPFLTNDCYVPRFSLFEISSKEGLDINNNIYKLNNFIPTEEFQFEIDALNYISKNIL